MKRKITVPTCKTYAALNKLLSILSVFLDIFANNVVFGQYFRRKRCARFSRQNSIFKNILVFSILYGSLVNCIHFYRKGFNCFKELMQFF